MANRRCFQALTRRASALFSANPPPPPSASAYEPVKALIASNTQLISTPPPHWSHQTRFLSSDRSVDVKDNEDEDDSEEEFDDDEDDVGGSSDDERAARGVSKREYTAEEKEAEAASIGYKVVGPLEKPDGVFKPYGPVFAVIQLILNKVRLVGTSSQTMIGRPIVPDATVHAIVEEHALDAKVLIFKKKTRKNYRRCKGHRQELTKLRIIDIQGIKKPEPVVSEKPSKAFVKKSEKVAVAV